MALSVHSKTSADLWHQHLGHLNGRSLQLLHQHKMVTGLDAASDLTGNCVGCVLGKHHRKTFSSLPACHQRQARLELVHTDLCGPMDESSLEASIISSHSLMIAPGEPGHVFFKPNQKLCNVFSISRLKQRSRQDCPSRDSDMTEVESTPPMSSRHSVQRVASFKSSQKLIHLSRMEWLREPTGRWLRWQDQCCTIIICLYHSGQRPSGQQPTH